MTSRKLLGPMYLICDATAHILIYCGGTKIKFSIFIFLSAYYKYEKHKNILILSKDKWVSESSRLPRSRGLLLMLNQFHKLCCLFELYML